MELKTNHVARHNQEVTFALAQVCRRWDELPPGLALAAGRDKNGILFLCNFQMFNVDQYILSGILMYPSSLAVPMTLTMLRPSTTTLRP